MSDETAPVWKDIWGYVVAWPKTASGFLGFALGMATRIWF